MEKYMKKSKVITFIGGFYIFGGIISFLSLLLDGSPLNTVFALPDIPDYIVKFLLTIIYIPAGYLFLKRVKFSNWLILALAVLTFCISTELTTTFNAHPDLFRRAIALEDNARPNLKTVQGLGRNYSWKERFGKEFCTHGNC